MRSRWQWASEGFFFFKMGPGVGSGSMMAAASGAIAAQQTPEIAKDIPVFRKLGWRIVLVSFFANCLDG